MINQLIYVFAKQIFSREVGNIHLNVTQKNEIKYRSINAEYLSIYNKWKSIFERMYVREGM